MKVSDLVNVVAKAAGFDEPRVKLYARYLRENGILPTGGRGLSAASVKPEHALDLLLALSVSETAADAARKLKNYYVLIDERGPMATRRQDVEAARNSIKQRLSPMPESFSPDWFIDDFRSAFGNMIRAEADQNALSNFTGKLSKYSPNHIFVKIQWPFPLAKFVIRAPEFGSADAIIIYGGTVSGEPAEYEEGPREQSVTFLTSVLLDIGKAFRNA